MIARDKVGFIPPGAQQILARFGRNGPFVFI
jgi:hypothetical protein